MRSENNRIQGSASGEKVSSPTEQLGSKESLPAYVPYGVSDTDHITTDDEGNAHIFCSSENLCLKFVYVGKIAGLAYLREEGDYYLYVGIGNSEAWFAFKDFKNMLETSKEVYEGVKTGSGTPYQIRYQISDLIKSRGGNKMI